VAPESRFSERSLNVPIPFVQRICRFVAFFACRVDSLPRRVVRSGGMTSNLFSRLLFLHSQEAGRNPWIFIKGFLRPGRTRPAPVRGMEVVRRALPQHRDTGGDSGARGVRGDVPGLWKRPSGGFGMSGVVAKREGLESRNPSPRARGRAPGWTNPERQRETHGSIEFPGVATHLGYNGLDQRSKTLKSNHPWMANGRRVGILRKREGWLLTRETLRRVTHRGRRLNQGPGPW